MKRLYTQLFADFIIAVTVFILSLWLKHGTFTEEIGRYGLPALYFYGFHFFISLANRKYEYGKNYNFRTLLRLWLRSWVYSSGIGLLLIYILQLSYFSREVVLTNILGLLAGEFLLIVVISLFRKSVGIQDLSEIRSNAVIDIEKLYPETSRKGIPPKVKNLRSVIEEQAGSEVTDFIIRHIDLDAGTTLVLDTTTRFNITNQRTGYYTQFANLHRINDIRYINKFFEAVNSRLPPGGLMMVCGEIKNQRKKRILDKYPPVLNWFYFAGDYLVLWLFPKMPALKKIYFMLTRGQGWVISRAEILGRIIHSGFEIVEEKVITGMTYVVARKVTLPVVTTNDTYGPLIHLKRIGKGGKMIKVYKLRTMHPYSEYLQEYIYKSNKLEKGGKIKRDYRITPLGRILRKFWLDELPMIWNLLRGDLKIVGIRPLSEHYFSLYSQEMQQRRIQFKPGLIPPFYCDMPRTFKEIEASEARYLDAYEKSPFRTDIRYFFKVVCNIVLHGARSR